MYKRILVPLEHSRYDDVILEHVRKLATLTGANLILLHVADGWAARNFKRLNLAESEEMRQDREYLERQEAILIQDGFSVTHLLATGEPSEEIIMAAERVEADLIAMATHGHEMIADFLFGTTADKVRHKVKIPVLMLRG